MPLLDDLCYLLTVLYGLHVVMATRCVPFMDTMYTLDSAEETQGGCGKFAWQSCMVTQAHVLDFTNTEFTAKLRERCAGSGTCFKLSTVSPAITPQRDIRMDEYNSVCVSLSTAQGFCLFWFCHL